MPHNSFTQSDPFHIFITYRKLIDLASKCYVRSPDEVVDAGFLQAGGGSNPTPKSAKCIFPSLPAYLGPISYQPTHITSSHRKILHLLIQDDRLTTIVRIFFSSHLLYLNCSYRYDRRNRSILASVAISKTVENSPKFHSLLTHPSYSAPRTSRPKCRSSVCKIENLEVSHHISDSRKRWR
ncbi:hypothetical protein N431DRAFT_77872 [Stipitochalara longipes BDJ]|nr:hypothetical protein N431DRAFT_77872 [Stipitochalara longipes BDJ]